MSQILDKSEPIIKLLSFVCVIHMTSRKTPHILNGELNWRASRESRSESTTSRVTPVLTMPDSIARSSERMASPLEGQSMGKEILVLHSVWHFVCQLYRDGETAQLIDNATLKWRQAANLASYSVTCSGHHWKDTNTRTLCTRLLCPVT